MLCVAGVESGIFRVALQLFSRATRELQVWADQCPRSSPTIRAMVAR